MYLGQYNEERFDKCVRKPAEMEGNFHRKSHVEINMFNKTAVRWVQDMVLKLNETLKVLQKVLFV